MGSILGGLFRHVLPLLRRGGIALGKEFFNSSLNVMKDVSDNNISLKDSMRERGRESLTNLKRKAVDKMSGGGVKMGKPMKKRKIRQSSVESKAKKTCIKKKSAAKKNKKKSVKKTAPKKKQVSRKKKKKKSDDFNIFN